MRKITPEAGFSHSSVARIIKGNNYHPYKVTSVQALNGDDAAECIEFCEWVMHRLDVEPTLLSDIIFSDEASFHLTRRVNRHNCRYWSDENLKWTDEANVQYEPRIMAWCAVHGDILLGPYFYEVLLLQATLFGRFTKMWFQQDGTPQLSKLVG